jgi:hypothetical protein
MALLATLVWLLNPPQPNFKPAPLEPPSAVCRNPGRQFVPSNLTSVPDPSLQSLPPDKKNAALLRLNTTACTCGCQLSVIYCKGLNSACATSGPMIKRIVDEASEMTPPSPGKK